MTLFGKRSAVLICFVLILLPVLSLADSISPYALGSINIDYRLTQKSGSVTGCISAMEPAGKTLSLTIAIQYQSSNGSWHTKTSATVQGDYVTATCATTSGTKYRLRYSYKLYNSNNELEESGSGYSHVLQVP